MDLSEAVVAGIWYGEGSLLFDVSPEMKYLRSILSIANSDLGLMVFVGSILEELGYKVSANEIREDKWEIRLGVFGDVVKFAKIILSLPGDGKKRQQLLIFLEEFVPIYEGRNLAWAHACGYRVWSRKEFLKAIEVVDKIALLKDKKGPKRKYDKGYFVKM